MVLCCLSAGMVNQLKDSISARAMRHKTKNQAPTTTLVQFDLGRPAFFAGFRPIPKVRIIVSERISYAEAVQRRPKAAPRAATFSGHFSHNQ
jgi:hypothetical protein